MVLHVVAVSLLLLGLWARDASANPAHDRLQQISSQERSMFFTKYLQGSGEMCDAVKRIFFQGLTKSGDAFWNVACRNGKAFSILIYNDAQGSSKIMDCPMLKAVNAGECFEKF